MGNDLLNFNKACMSPNHLCDQQFNQELQNQNQFILKKHKIKSTQEIKQKILHYVQTNNLQLYPLRQKKVLQTLVSVQQEHVSDKIIQFEKLIKSLQNQKRQLQKTINKQPSKTLSKENNEEQIKTQTEQRKEKLKQLNQKITNLKSKRKRLFEDAQCLLLEDLDMIFQQIPNFDQNYEYLNSILSLSQSLMQKNKRQKNNNSIESNPASNINLLTITNSSSVSKFNNESNHQNTSHNFSSISNTFKSTSLGMNMTSHIDHRKQKKLQQKIKANLKIQDKKTLRKNIQFNKAGVQILQSNSFLIIIPIQCFSGIGALIDNKNTGLPSKATLLQVLLNKIKAVIMRRNCNLGVAFLVNQKYLDQFNQQMSKVGGAQNYVSFQKLQINSNLSNLQSQQNFQPLIHYNVIAFKNIWPSFDANQKIMLDKAQDQIIFSTHDGDLIAFIQNSIQLKLIIEKYQYVNITNPNNLLSQIGDSSVLGFMQKNEQIDIVVKILKPTNLQTQYKNYFNIDDQQFFTIKQNQSINQIIQNQKLTKNLIACYNSNQPFLNIDDYYIKSRIFITESGPLKRLLMSKISRKVNPQLQNNQIEFYLYRSIDSILYSKFTAFVMVQECYEFSHIKTSLNYFNPHVIKNGAFGYSKYCRKLLGLKECDKEKQSEEMVQIDAGILHKGSEQLMKIINSLKKVKQIGFPLILYSELFNNVKQSN